MRVADLKKVVLTGCAASGSVKNVTSWIVTTVGTPGAQRHRVVRRVDDVRADLLGDERQARSAPTPAGPARCAIAAGPATTRASGASAAVALLVGPLARDGEVGALRVQGATIRPST